MSDDAAALSQRGRIWFDALTAGGRVINQGVRSVLVGDAQLGNAHAGEIWARLHCRRTGCEQSLSAGARR